MTGSRPGGTARKGKASDYSRNVFSIIGWKGKYEIPAGKKTKKAGKSKVNDRPSPNTSSSVESKQTLKRKASEVLQQPAQG
jgi:hypothetical protein